MRHTVKLPKLGDSSDDAVVVEIYLEVGESHSAGTPFLRVETNKAEVDVELPVGGIVAEILVAVDDEVETGDPLARIEAS